MKNYKVKITKAKIEVYESSLSMNVIYRFSCIEQLLAMNARRNWNADQIAINDCVLMGWDELYVFV